MLERDRLCLLIGWASSLLDFVVVVVYKSVAKMWSLRVS